MDWKSIPIENLRSIYDMMSLKGKIAFITGAAGGIGRTSAAVMAEAGAAVVLADLPEKSQRLGEIAAFLRERHGVETLEVTGDVADEAEVKNMFAAVKQRFGGVDIVHSNAGYATPDDTLDMELAVWQRMLDVNYTGAMVVAREGAKLMKEGNRGGSIIFTASICGHIINRRPEGRRYSPGYTSTKAAIRHVAKVLAMDYLPWNIRVNSISPGYIESGPKRSTTYVDFNLSQVPMGRFGTLNDLAGAILFFASDLSSYNTGTDLLVDGGYCAW